jgi:LysR family transcriptional regulator, glycine cleavage system transcriptional activator
MLRRAPDADKRCLFLFWLTYTQATMRLPPLTALRAFDAAARSSSFTLAAEELCVTTGAVSRQIRLLESHLGVALFTRHHRRVILTLAGEHYASAVARVFAELAEAGDALGRDTRQALVRINCVPTLSMYWLTPRLARYRTEHPDTRIEITTSLGPVDPAGAFDLAIRRDTRHFSGLSSEPFMTEWCMPLCSRQFADTHGLTSPEKLLRAPTLHIRAREDLWPTWTKRYGLPASAPLERTTLDHTFAALQAAEDGLGSVVMPLLFARKQLDAGHLIAPFPDMLAESGRYYVLMRQGSGEREALAVKAWLLDEGARSRND